jgi:hypothetical protein
MERDFEEENNLLGAGLINRRIKKFRKKHPKMARRFGKRFKRMAPLIGMSPAVIRVNTYDPVTGENHWKLFKKIGAALKKVAQKVGSLVKTTALLPAILPLLPVMKAALRKKKISVSNNPMKIVQAFYDAFIARKGKSYEELEEHYSGSDSIVFIAAIIPPVIKFVKALIQKKKRGEPIPEEFKEAAAEAVKVEDKLVQAANAQPGGAAAVLKEVAVEAAGGPPAKDGPPVTGDMGSLLTSPWLIAGGAVLVLIVVAIAFRKNA